MIKVKDKLYRNALQCSLESPYILHPHDGKVINVKRLPNIESYRNEKNVIIRPKNFFNGSICRFKGRIIFAFRCDQPNEKGFWWDYIRVAICELDENYNPIQGTEQYLNLSADSGRRLHVEDPRLFTDGSRLYIAYTDASKMYWSELDESLSVLKNFGEVSKFSKKSAFDKATEKNWVPFIRGNKVHWLYSADPQIVLDGDNPWISGKTSRWSYGHIRGGTPAIPWKEGYISFFHSSLLPQTLDTPVGQRVYFMGAYTFSPDPPFSFRLMTALPIMKGAPYPRFKNRPTNAYVTFPSGVIEEADHFVVSYGCNDYCTRIARISKPLLEKILQ